MKLYGDLCGGLVCDFGLQRCCRNTRTTRNNTIRVKKRVHLFIIASNSCKVYTVADILKGVAQPRLDRKGRGQQPSREHAGSWGPWPPSWVGRSLGLHGSMVDNRSSRISKLLENAKATLPRISLPLWKGAIHENSKVDQLDLYRKPFPASNAIPFSVSIAQPDLEESFSASMLHGNVEEAKEVVPILPWLYRACGKMGESYGVCFS